MGPWPCSHCYPHLMCRTAATARQGAGPVHFTPGRGRNIDGLISERGESRRLPCFCAAWKYPYKSRYLPCSARLAHNFIHILCAEAPRLVRLAFSVWKVFHCSFFTHGKISLMNQGTWQRSPPLLTILSTLAVQKRQCGRQVENWLPVDFSRTDGGRGRAPPRFVLPKREFAG